VRGERRYWELAEQEDEAALLYFVRGQAAHLSCKPRTSYEAVLLLCDDQLRIDCFVYEAGTIIPYAARRNCPIRAGDSPSLT
jgi:hypothetical protein